jgi:hypothetical protein
MPQPVMVTADRPQLAAITITWRSPTSDRRGGERGQSEDSGCPRPVSGVE